MADLSSKSLKELKTLIERGNLSHRDCLSRAELEARAAEAVARSAHTLATLFKDGVPKPKPKAPPPPPPPDSESEDSDGAMPGLFDGEDGEVRAADSDEDSDSDSGSEGMPGLESEDEEENQPGNKRKPAAAPAPPPKPLTKSQQKALKVKRQKLRKMAALADSLRKGDEVFVTKNGVEVLASVIKVHRDDPECFYITLAGPEGTERQTLLSRCRPAEGAERIAAAREATIAAAAAHGRKVVEDQAAQAAEVERLASVIGDVSNAPKAKPKSGKKKARKGAKK